MKNKIVMSLILFPLIISCSDRKFIDGRTEFIGITDTIINDSSIIEGNVYHIDGYNDMFASGEFTVWIQEINLIAETDTRGKYSIKIAPGTYNLNCESMGNRYQRLIESMRINLAPNQKAVIDFYIGYAIE